MKGFSCSGPKRTEVGLVRRRRAARSKTPRAARIATPPNVPTIAGTRGTTAELDVADGEAEEEVVGDGAAIPVVGALLPPVGDTQVRPAVEGVLDLVRSVVMLLRVPLMDSILEVVGKEVAERLKKVGMLVTDGNGRVVRLDGRLLMISDGFTVGSVVTPAVSVGVGELEKDSSVVDIEGSGGLVEAKVSSAVVDTSSDDVWIADSPVDVVGGISVKGTGREILDVGSSDVKGFSGLVVELGKNEVSVRLPIPLVVIDAADVSTGGMLTLPVTLSGAVNVGKAVGNERLVPAVGRGIPPIIPSDGKLAPVSEADVVVF